MLTLLAYQVSYHQAVSLPTFYAVVISYPLVVNMLILVLIAEHVKNASSTTELGVVKINGRY